MGLTGIIITFVVIAAIIEFIAMIMTFNDFGDSGFMSMIISGIITLVIVLASITVDSVVTVGVEQQEQLEEQWPVNSDELSNEDIKRLEEELYEVDEPDEGAAETATVIPKTTTQAIPTNTQHIDNNRRNYRQEVEYSSIAKQACYHLGCFSAQLVQHSDGTFWACRRNYGTCYQYITKGN